MRSQGKCTLNAIKLAEAIAITTVMNWHRQTEQIEARNQYDLCRCIIRNKCENDTMFHKFGGEYISIHETDKILLSLTCIIYENELQVD